MGVSIGFDIFARDTASAVFGHLGTVADETRAKLLGLGEGMASSESAMSVAAREAAAATESAAAKVETARKREMDAAGQVRVAETRLEEARAKYAEGSSQVVTAEERLAKAQRAETDATIASGKAAAEAANAQLREAEATVRTGEAATASGGKFSRAATSVSAANDKMLSGIGRVSKGALGMAGVFAGFAAADFAGHSLKGAIDFQRASQVLVTAAGESVKNLSMIRSGLVHISSTTGTDLEQVTEGMYTVEKAGFRGARALEVMRVATLGAKDEGANLGTVAAALTTIMQTSDGKITNASKAMNALMTAAGHSKTSLQEFADSLSNVLPISAKLHIPFNQVAGAMSAMTAQGMSARRASMNLNHAIVSLANPTSVQAKEMDAFGISAADVRDKLGQRGLQGTIDYLAHAVTGSMNPAMRAFLGNLHTLPPAAQDLISSFRKGTLTLSSYESKVGSVKGVTAGQRKEMLQAIPAMTGYQQAIAKMTGGQVGLQVAMMLTGQTGKIFKQSTDEVGQSLNSVAEFTGKTKMTMSATANQLSVAKTTMANVGVTIATALLPPLATLAKAFATVVSASASFVGKNWSWIKPTAIALAALVVVTKAYGVAMAVDAAGGLVAYITASKAAAVVSKAFAAVQWLVNAALDANPIGIVVLAIAALAAGLIYAYKHSKTFRDIVQGAMRDVGAAMHWLWNNVGKPAIDGLVTGWHLVAKGATWMWSNVLKPTFKFIVDAFLNLAGSIIHGAAWAFGWVPGLGSKLKQAAQWFDGFKQHVNNQLDGIHPAKIRADTSPARAALNSFMSYGIGVAAQGITVAINATTTGTRPRHHRASGGMVSAGELYRINENTNSEGYFVPPASGRVVPAHEMRQVSKGGSKTVIQNINITLPGITDRQGAARELQKILLEFKRHNGGAALGIA